MNLRFKKKVTFKILLLLIISDLLETAIHLFFKKSTLEFTGSQVTNLTDAMIFLGVVSRSPYLWLGLLTVAGVFILWSLVLSKIDLSVAVPVASFSYILIPVVSIVFLHEKITAWRWLGVFFILAGVIFVSLSSKERTEQAK
jgi:drug/metabolite transporter (DMT)-like permease